MIQRPTLRALCATLLALLCAACAPDPPAIAPTPAVPPAAPATVVPAAPAAPGQPGATAPAAATPAAQGNLSLVGALALEPYDRSMHADVAAYKQLAFVGTRCRGGVHIVDISNPAAPAELATSPAYPNTSMEDIQAVAIGGRDVLAAGLQDCGNNPILGRGRLGLALFDISDPRNPAELGIVDLDAGVHEFDLVHTPDGRALALLAVPGYEASYSSRAWTEGSAGLVIADISDPANPQILSNWNVTEAPEFGSGFAQSVARGSTAAALLHSVRASEDATRAYLSYWDAGVIILDIRQPEQPVVLGRTAFAPDEEGNAHSVAEAGGAILVQADEDFDPIQIVVTSSAFEGRRPALEIGFTAPISALPERQIAGAAANVGRACFGDAPLPDLAGRIALIERGGCALGEKLALAQQAGASATIIYDNPDAAPEDGISGDTATLPDGTIVNLNTPALFVDRETGLLLAGSPATQVRAAAEFDGRGGVRIYDIADPAGPKLLSAFATENARRDGTGGRWTAHNPEVDGDTLYVSWYNDGVRAIDISNPAEPREIGAWAGEGAPAGAPPVSIWGVVLHDGLILASDMDFGLYILARHG